MSANVRPVTKATVVPAAWLPKSEPDASPISTVPTTLNVVKTEHAGVDQGSKQQEPSA